MSCLGLGIGFSLGSLVVGFGNCTIVTCKECNIKWPEQLKFHRNYSEEEGFKPFHESMRIQGTVYILFSMSMTNLAVLTFSTLLVGKVKISLKRSCRLSLARSIRYLSSFTLGDDCQGSW